MSDLVNLGSLFSWVTSPSSAASGPLRRLRSKRPKSKSPELAEDEGCLGGVFGGLEFFGSVTGPLISVKGL